MTTKPNLLFLFTDEQRFDTMACYGNRHIRTPHLNALAEQSVVFENAYCTQPVCTPSRSSIMTGLYPHSTGCLANNVPLKPETPTIAEMLPDDYRCAYYGKWHLGDEIIPQHGFPDWVSIEDLYREFYSRPEYLDRFSSYHHFLVENGFTPDRESCGGRVFARRTVANLDERFTKAGFLGREAARFIPENRDRPFALYVNFLEPHMPFTGPFNDLYPPESLPVESHFLQPPADSASLLHRRMAAHYMGSTWGGHDLTTEAGWRRIRANYWGLVTLVDRAVGRILAALDESGLAENTIVVFTSDHGDMMGDHGILAKCVMYEEAMKVPLLMRVPWLGREQRLVTGRVSQIDLVPTLLDLMGVGLPDGLQGESRSAVLRGETTLAGSDVFVEWNGRDGREAAMPLDAPDEEGNRAAGATWRTVVSADGWKLNLSAGDRCELYDLNADPCERTNRFDDPAQRGRVRDLIERIGRWQTRTGDTVPLSLSGSGSA